MWCCYEGSGVDGSWEPGSSDGKGAGVEGVALAAFRRTTRSVTDPPKLLLFCLDFFFFPRPLLPVFLDSFNSSPCSGESPLDVSFTKDPNSGPLAAAAATPSGERNNSTAGNSRASGTDVKFPSSSSWIKKNQNMSNTCSNMWAGKNHQQSRHLGAVHAATTGSTRLNISIDRR